MSRTHIPAELRRLIAARADAPVSTASFTKTTRFLDVRWTTLISRSMAALQSRKTSRLLACRAIETREATWARSRPDRARWSDSSILASIAGPNTSSWMV